MEKVKVFAECKSVTRKAWDEDRKCYKYTALFQPVSDEKGDLFDECDLFARDLLIPIRDSAIRTKHRDINAPVVQVVNGQAIEPAADALTAWDTVVSKDLVGIKRDVFVVTASVSELTDGKYTEYTIKVGNEKYVVSSRNLPCLKPDEAVARLRNQVLRECKKQENEGQA